jgi:hypothetical protein
MLSHGCAYSTGWACRRRHNLLEQIQSLVWADAHSKLATFLFRRFYYVFHLLRPYIIKQLNDYYLNGSTSYKINDTWLLLTANDHLPWWINIVHWKLWLLTIQEKHLVVDNIRFALGSGAHWETSECGSKEITGICVCVCSSFRSLMAKKVRLANTEERRTCVSLSHRFSLSFPFEVSPWVHSFL